MSNKDREDAATWTCACNYMNSGHVCTHCGKAKPEDRQASARRVARDLVWADYDKRIEFNNHDPDALEADILAALLAFPGGNAEPLAWRVVCADGSFDCPAHRHSCYTTESWSAIERDDLNASSHSCSPHRVEPLYAAPDAGEAGALREALEKYGDHGLCALTSADRGDDGCTCGWDEIRDALLAPGGRPVTDAGFTCAFCGRMHDGPQPVAEFCTKRPGDGKCLPGGRDEGGP